MSESKEKIDIQDMDNSLLNKISDLNKLRNGAYNIRKNGKGVERKVTENINIAVKEDKSGIDIFVKENTKFEYVYIPVILTESGLSDVVYNDFYIGENANVTIVAGCGIHNCNSKDSEHNGIHRFYLEKNAKVKYIEKHYGEGDGSGKRILNPITEIYLKENSSLDMDSNQIKGVDSTERITKGELGENSILTVSEKIMTHGNQYAKTIFDVKLNGKKSSTHVVSRSVATENSKQEFISNIYGNNECYAHTECDAIIKDDAKAIARPEVFANNIDANLVHEATIGKIAGEQLIKLMSLGLSEKQAEEQIIKGFLK